MGFLVTVKRSSWGAKVVEIVVALNSLRSVL